MIRINLLPVRDFKRKETVRREITIFFLTVVVVVGLMGAYYFILRGQAATLQVQKEQLTKTEEGLRKRLAKLAKEQKVEEELKAKLDTIKTLEASRRGPVRFLDEISQRIPAKNAWLTQLTQSGAVLTIKGLAMDNETVVLFMAQLEKSDYLANVQLIKSQQKIINEIKLKDFSITCGTVIPQEKKDEASKEDKPAVIAAN